MSQAGSEAVKRCWADPVWRANNLKARAESEAYQTRSGPNLFRSMAKAQRKFTPEQIQDIRREYADGATQQGLATAYDCSQLVISKIVRRITYQEVS